MCDQGKGRENVQMADKSPRSEQGLMTRGEGQRVTVNLTLTISLTRTSRKSQKTNYKLQIKLKYQIRMSNKTITFSDFVWEFENWVLENLIFVISYSAKKWQKITCQLLKANDADLIIIDNGNIKEQVKDLFPNGVDKVLELVGRRT